MSIWGEGLCSKRYLKCIALRRNSLVYEVEINFKRFRFSFLLMRKISSKAKCEPPVVHKTKPCALCGRLNNNGHESCDRCFEKLQ